MYHSTETSADTPLSVFWGTLGPHKLFGSNGQYRALLAGFPVGFALPISA
jgi:hypothetical protein